MSTQNSIDSQNPIQVALGGTGLATATTDGILYGKATSALGVTAAGTTGQLLTATTSSAPTWVTPTIGTCMFSYYLNASATGVTGTGTVYTILCATKIYDLGSNYSGTTGKLTAPTTGYYQLSWGISASGLTSATTNVIFNMVTTARTYQLYEFTTATTITVEAISGSNLVFMTAGDTASLTIETTGQATNLTAVTGSATNPLTWFSGYRVF